MTWATVITGPDGDAPEQRRQPVGWGQGWGEEEEETGSLAQVYMAALRRGEWRRGPERARREETLGCKAVRKWLRENRSRRVERKYFKLTEGSKYGDSEGALGKGLSVVKGQ